jgi:adenylate cyclase
MTNHAVARADAPRMLRLGGETREVTAMFTDMEGFTSLTDRSNPRDVLQLLDGYLTIVTDTVAAHGGMVDKLIGDGAFALFNARRDVVDHTRHAVAAAKAIIAATESYRKTPLALKLKLGRTRVGIEAGTAIVGGADRDKFGPTAIGTVVNTASRLEGVNKAFKTSICIGPAAAAKLGAREIELLGAIQVRGLNAALKVFTVAEWRTVNVCGVRHRAAGGRARQARADETGRGVYSRREVLRLA